MKKQTGGHGQFAVAWLEVEPLSRGEGFEFVDRIVGGVVPRNFIPAVEKGVREALPELTEREATAQSVRLAAAGSFQLSAIPRGRMPH